VDKRTVQAAHARIDNLEKEVVMIKTEVKIQFKDLFGRVKRLETILIAATGTILIMLLTVLSKMP
jgi:tetrahydromethanopterin S-methyltransferase subunit G